MIRIIMGIESPSVIVQRKFNKIQVMTAPIKLPKFIGKPDILNKAPAINDWKKVVKVKKTNNKVIM